MEGRPLITNADENKLVSLINQARERVLYMAPGLTNGVAQSLTSAWFRLGLKAVTVVLDADPEICRLGYGTLEGLKTITATAGNLGSIVCQQPGVRIGLLISDEVTLIYSPTPLLIEGEASHPEHPNAVQLDTTPRELTNEMGLGDENAGTRLIGIEPIPTSKVEMVEADLKTNPPAKFNLARKVRVYTSLFQFVELEMAGCYISRKKVPIPSSLVGMAKDRGLQSQFHAQFNLVNNEKLEVKVSNRMFTEKTLRKQREDIVKRFLIPLTGYGNVVLRSNKDKLEKAVEELRTDVKAFQEGIEKDLQKHMDENAQALIKALLPAVAQNPPDQYMKIYGPQIKEEHIRGLMEQDITKAFGKAADLVTSMTIKLIFKDVTYESLNDQNFLVIARKAMPGIESLHEEFQAAKAEGFKQEEGG
ncbi:MAG: hypothetical protein ACYDHW_01230 [Syntrophorhabdaceae bacterium]